MAIECYYGDCRFHGSRDDPEEGPFCFQVECRASDKELQEYEAKRAQWLATVAPIQHCSLGVGCEEYGVCYAESHGQPKRCGRK